MHIPRIYEEIDSLRARIVKSFFSTRPYIDFIPQPSQGAVGELNEEKAQVASAVVDMQLNRNKITAKFYDFVTSVLIFPAGVLGVGWRYEKKKAKRRLPFYYQTESGFAGVMLALQEVEVTEWDDNEIVNVDYFDFWPDPRGTDLDSCRFVFQREWSTKEQIESKLELLKETGSGEVWAPDFESLRGAGGGLEEGRWQRLSAVGIAPETGFSAGSEDMYELLHYWTDDEHAIIINRTDCIYFGENPYWRHGKKPFVVASYEPLPNEFYGMSAVQIIEYLQHELNTLRNQRIDNISFVLNRMLKVRRSADISPEELVSRPHGIIYVDSPDDVMEFPVSDITASSYNDERVIKEDMENVLGVPAVVRGANSTKQETATEVVTKTSNAGIRFDVKIMLFETLGIKRLAYLMDCNNQQFIDSTRLIKLFGVEGPAAWREVRPEELVGEYDYRPAGANVDPAANKEVRRQQLNQLMQTVLSSGNPYVDVYELTKVWLESYDIRGVEKLLVSKDELAVQQAVSQQVVSQQQLQTVPVLTQQQAGEGGIDALLKTIYGGGAGG